MIQWAHNRPNNPITIYRAVPFDLARPKISPGDWVTTVRKYAKEHGESALRGRYKIISKMVAVRDLYTDGNSIFEFGYDPQPPVPRTKR
jgi:orotate phosphoribosyltransferase